jgi:hypothetical protein
VVGWFWPDGRRGLVLLLAVVGGIVLIRWVCRPVWVEGIF